MSDNITDQLADICQRILDADGTCTTTSAFTRMVLGLTDTIAPALAAYNAQKAADAEYVSTRLMEAAGWKEFPNGEWYRRGLTLQPFKGQWIFRAAGANPMAIIWAVDTMGDVRRLTEAVEGEGKS